MSRRSNAWDMNTTLCPFARGETAKTISCEGFIDDVSVMTSAFISYRAKAVQKKVFCDRDFEKCEIYRMIMNTKYDD